MKDFVLLAAVCLVVVVGVGWLLIPGSASDLFRSRVTVAAEPSDTPDVVPVAAKTRPKPVQVRAPERGPEIASVPASPAPVEFQPRPSAVVPPEPVRLPSPWEVLPGEERSEIVDTYGTPSLSTSTQDAGHLFETFVYRTSRTQAIVHLEDGKVSRVFLKDSPQTARP